MSVKAYSLIISLISLKDNYDVQLLDLDNQKSLSSIHKLRNHKLQQHSIPIKTVHSKHELIDLINSIDDNQYLIIDSGGFDSLYTRLAILGADINISPTADKTIELLALVLLMIPLCINSLVSYAKIFPVMFFLIESITLLKISLILILFCLNLNISKCSLTLYYTIKLSFVKELFMTKFT